MIVGKVYHCTGAYWPVQRVAFQIEEKWAQYTHSRGYLRRFPTVIFQTSTPAIIRLSRRACTVTLAIDVSKRGGGYRAPPSQGLCGGPVQTECKCTRLEAEPTIPLKRIARRQRYVSRRDASCRICGRYALGLPAVVLEDC